MLANASPIIIPRIKSPSQSDTHRKPDRRDERGINGLAMFWQEIICNLLSPDQACEPFVAAILTGTILTAVVR
jgi:hypothetical protein